MRFVHYYPGAMGSSGVTMALWGWAREQVRAGGEVVILHAYDEAEQRDTNPFLVERDEAVTRVAIPHRGGNRLTRRPADLGRMLRSDDLLVLHEGWVTANLVAAEVARRRRIPYVVMPHGVYDPSWRRYLKPPRVVRHAFERRMLENAAAVHVFFESEEPPIRALAPRARFVVAPSGIDMPTATWRGGGGYLVWIGRYDPVHKGLDILLDALARLPEPCRPRVRLQGYDYRGGTRRLKAQLAQRPELIDLVEVGGRISGAEKERLLVESDGYVMPSRWESQGLALFEALALGVPAVASSTMSAAPVIARYDSAILADPQPQRVADAIGQLPARAPELSAQARSMVASEFSWDRIMTSYLGQLEALDLARIAVPHARSQAVERDDTVA